MNKLIQEWALELSVMQQTVLLEVIRGPDGVTKYHVSKYLLRWYRRCLLISAFDGRILNTPYEDGGGSFTGPSYKISDKGCGPWQNAMDDLVSEVIRSADELPHHFYRHMMHGIEIMGYKHSNEEIRRWWYNVYIRLSRDMHLNAETEIQLDDRLGDTRDGWLRHGDLATVA